MRRLVGFLILGLAGCAQFPEIDAANRASPPAGDPPALLPFDELARASTINTSPPEDIATIEARAAALGQAGARTPSSAGTAADLAALKARAAILRQPVEDFDQLEELRAKLADTP